MNDAERVVRGGDRSMLVVDDDPSVASLLRRIFERAGWTVHVATDGRAGLVMYAQQTPDIVLLDIGLPGLDGFEVLDHLRASDPDATVIVLTGGGDVASAVRAMKAGAENFLAKPFEPAHLQVAVERAVENANMRRRNRFLAQRELDQSSLESLGDSPPMRELAHQIGVVARGRAPILLSGETGSGKGWAAKLIHGASDRRDQPFVSLNCASLSATFLDTELFGHEPGAFTDARTRKLGLFEIANGGTLMLDEIGDLAPELQPKLLTVLETQRFRRLGGTRELQVDTRLIAATHVDLDAAVRKGTFRQDLYYRIAVMPVHIPSLRERGPEEIRDLTLRLLADMRRQLARGPTRVSADAMKLVLNYSWPGNVRELRNVLERSLALAEGADELAPNHLPADLRARIAVDVPGESDYSLQIAERKHIERVLAVAKGNRRLAAKMLGVSRQTLYNRLAAFGLQDEPSA